MTKTSKIGLVGWRGMVGSVLLQRMETENDHSLGEYHLFSSSLKGQVNSEVPWAEPTIQDPHNINRLREMDCILTCAGSAFSKRTHPILRESGWEGYWIDASSAFRLRDHALLTLDPINHNRIIEGLESGKKDMIGGNCTVSLLLLSIAGLLQRNLIEWVSTQTYQAASGAGAQPMKELLLQYRTLIKEFSEISEGSPLEMEAAIRKRVLQGDIPIDQLGAPLAFNLLPWIDQEYGKLGQSREEWKAEAEAQKILQLKSAIPIDGTCVRVSSLRCHSQAITLKLKEELSIREIEKILQQAHSWIRLVPNRREDSLQELHPIAVSGSLDIRVGRIRHLRMGPQFINIFSVGDQLLWGAAEPLRRSLRILMEWQERGDSLKD